MNGVRRRSLAMVAALAAAMSPGLAKAQPAASGSLRERTGPMAAPQSAPDYARPTPGLASPPSAPAGAASLPTDSELGSLTVVNVAREGPGGDALPAAAWIPPQAPGANLRLDYLRAERLDEAWVRRQFALNGLPRGGVSQALARGQLINRAFLSVGYLNSGRVVRPASGVALSWLLLLTLGLPVIDYARSYRPWVYLVAQHVPNGVCVAAQLPRSALAALENYSNWRIDAKGDVAKTTACEYLLVDESRRPPVAAPPGWLPVAHLHRPSERDESTAVFKKATAPTPRPADFGRVALAR